MNTFRMLADNWASLLLTISWQLAALGALAWMCEKVFRLRPARARYALWWFVLVAPLLLAPVRLTLSQTPAVVKVPVLFSVPMPARLPAAPLVSAEPMPQPAISPSPAAAARPVKHGAWRMNLRAADVLGWLWLLGCAGFTLRLLVGYRQVRKMLAESRPVKDRAMQDLFAALCAEAALRNPVDLRVSDTIGAPAICGVMRPKILLPATWLETAAAEELRALLAHEVAHIKRRDPVTNFGQRLIEIPLFFHPAAWWASRKITLVREELCDAWVLHRGANAAGYARFLVAAAESASLKSAGMVVGLAEGRSTLLHRVEAIMKTQKNGKISRVMALVVAAVVLLCAGAFAVVQLSREEQGKEDINTAKVTQVNPDSPMTAQELSSVLSSAGIHVYRFSYTVPYRHRIFFSVREYINGKRSHSVPSIDGLSTSGNAGKNTNILTTKYDGNELAFSVSNNMLSSSATIEIGNFMSFVSKTLKYDNKVFAHYYGLLNNIQLVKGKAVPIFIYGLIGSTRAHQGSPQSDDIEDVIRGYDGLILIYAELKPLEEVKQEAEIQSPSAAPGTVFDTIDLRNLDAEEMKILFGAASLPKTTDWEQRPKKQNSKDLAQGINLQSPFKSLLPPGVTIISPAEHGSRQLVVSGTPEGIARTRELVRIFDQQAKRVRLEVSYCAGAPEKTSPENWFALKLSGPKDLRAEIGSIGEGLQSGISAESLRASQKSIDALNNVPVRTILSPSGWPQMLLTIVPRINGDSSVTFSFKLGLLDPKEKPEAAAARAEAEPILSTVINVKSNEHCALSLVRPQGKLTIIIRFAPTG